MRIVRVVVLLLALLALPDTAMARNVALVIGNSTYGAGNSLANPGNDSRLIADTARRTGFEVVQANDLSRAAFEQALRSFRAQADGADIAMIYYAGHGIEARGKNWLIPTDAKLENDFDLTYEALELDNVLSSLEGARIRIVVLDACRNNPFGTNWKSGTRSVTNGLAKEELDGVVVIYAAAAGQVATDGAGGNSPFAAALARRMQEPGLQVQNLGNYVRDDVMQATGQRQKPFVSSSITATPAYIVPPVAPVAAQAPAQGGGDQSTADAYSWRIADATNSAIAFTEYLRTFPNGIFASNARARLAQLQAAAAPSAPVQIASRAATQQYAPAPQPAPVPAAQPEAQVAAARETPVAVVAPSPAPALPSPPAPEPAAIAAARPAIATGVGGLPVMPAAPQFNEGAYPGCKDDFRAQTVNINKVNEINRCMVALDDYQRGTLQPFRFAMNKHQIEIGQIYTEQVGGTGRYQPELQNQWYDAMVRENAASLPDGANYSAYRPVEARYNADRAYLDDRYCYYTGCKGYPALSMLGNDAEPAKPAK